MRAGLALQHAQRGMSTLAVTSVMLAALMLAVVFAHRGLLLEQKSSGNRYKAAQAFEAAEAGLEWAIARLNDATPIGDDCLPAPDAAAPSFRERYLAPDADGEWSARATLGVIACASTGDGAWACQCPVDASPPAVGREAPSRFSVRLLASDRAGQLRVVSAGCSAGEGPCKPGAAAGDATAQVEVLLARVPGLGSPPAAALTVRQSATLADAAFHLHNTTPASGGTTLHAGGSVDAPRLLLSSVPGAPSAASAWTPDAPMAALGAEGLFASVFRMDRKTWKQQPTVHTLACAAGCDARLASLASGAVPQQLIWLDGGLTLATPLTLGTPERPVLLVVDGPTTLHAKLTLHGLLYATDAAWRDDAASSVQGAVVFENALVGQGDTRIHHDAAVLQALQRSTGTFARVPGSWRDF